MFKKRSGLTKKYVTSELEQFVFDTSINFIDVTPAETDKLIESTLQLITERTEANRAYIYLLSDNKNAIQLSHIFDAEKSSKKIERHEQIESEDFNWFIQPLREGNCLRIERLKDIPAKANSIKLILESENTQSLLACPLKIKNELIGFLGFDYLHQSVKIPNDFETFLMSMGRIFSAAINRLRSVKSGLQIEQKLRTLFSEIEDVVYVSSPEGKFLEVNPAGVKMFGYDSLPELLEIDIEKDLYQNTIERETFKRIIEFQGHVKDYESEFKTRDGSILVVQETATVVKDGEGNVQAYQGIIRDVTNKRKLEQQLFQAQKLESIGLLAGGLAHDINNILTAINGYSSLMLMTMEEANPHERHVRNIIKGSKRAEDLIRQLLAFSSQQMIQPKVVEINSVIHELHDMLHRLITEDIEFKLELDDELSPIKADPGQIQQILVNLVVNAGHAIKNKKRKSKKLIVVSTEQVKLTKRFVNKNPGSRVGKFIKISVRDSGCGMDEQTKNKIFEPFFTTKKESGGTGLGLSTVYGIVKQNNCNIYVESEPQKGTEFNIYWPVTTEKKKRESQVETKVQFKDRSETILLVEDDEDVRDLTGKGLVTFGYSVIDANNGQHALEKIRKEALLDKIDLVISDMVMPEMGGEELAMKLRKLNPSINILLCSGYTNSRIISEESDGPTAFHFIAKPYTIPKLDKKIRSILN